MSSWNLSWKSGNKMPASNDNISILVLRGGPGVEREVSLAGGRCVGAALRRAGYKVIEKDILPEDLSALDEGGFDLVFPVLHGTFGEDGELQAILEGRGIAFLGSGSESSPAVRRHPRSVRARSCQRR